jgi:hypothetical protein
MIVTISVSMTLQMQDKKQKCSSNTLFIALGILSDNYALHAH